MSLRKFLNEDSGTAWTQNRKRALVSCMIPLFLSLLSIELILPMVVYMYVIMPCLLLEFGYKIKEEESKTDESSAFKLGGNLYTETELSNAMEGVFIIMAWSIPLGFLFRIISLPLISNLAFAIPYFSAHLYCFAMNIPITLYGEAIKCLALALKHGERVSTLTYIFHTYSKNSPFNFRNRWKK